MSVMPHTGMVLAAGLGKRMRPLTNAMPKPMIAVGGKPMVDHAIDALQQARVSKVVVNTSYKAEVLEAHLASRRNPSIVFSREASPLETGGGIKKALPHLGMDPFFVMNGDIVCMSGATPFLERLRANWQQDLRALLLVQPTEKAIGYEGAGDFFVDESGGISMRGDAARAPYVFTGIQILHPELFRHSPEGAFSLTVLFREQMLSGGATRIRALVHDGAWYHVGDPAALDKVNRLI